MKVMNMKEFLNNIRKVENNLYLKNKIINTLLIFILGIILGVFSKWLDNIVIDSSVWWMNIIERFDLNNFFSEMAIWLFIAMAISVFKDEGMKENNVNDIFKRLNRILYNRNYLRNLNTAKNNWLELPIDDVVQNVLHFFETIQFVEI